MQAGPQVHAQAQVAIQWLQWLIANPLLYLDNLAREFGLGDRDRMKLRGFLQVCGNTGLRPGELLGQLYMLAVVLSEAAERRRAAQENVFGGDLRAMMRDLQIRLDDSFSLTTTQKANVRGITQDVIHEATRTAFSAMHVDVLVILKDRKQYLDLDNIFGVPVREKKLMSALKRACSSVRNAYRQDIRDSIDPASFVPLDKITYTLASKYKLGGRRFAFDSPDLLWTDEADGEDDSESSNPPAKKRKTTTKQGGRIAAGADFWGKVDAHFKDQVALRGRNFKDARWKPYIDRILADDASKFAGIVPGAPVSSLSLESSPGAPDASFGGALAQYGTTPEYTTFGFTNGVGFDIGSVGAWGNSFSGIVGQS
ncbi:hypothetical protein R3P38DRAFT_3463884 [Favolaschia claudopus]|uniref:Uncharacterized protein n=1 Tax=Favolaschia claudopus TaxID=2862362 RepID=A0AAV9ZFW4_9AGAR